MAQDDFYLCDSDVEIVAKHIFSRGARIVPDLEYRSPKYCEINSWDALKPLIENTRNLHLFAIGDVWQKAPLEVKPLTRNGVTTYYISQKNGGPTIDIAINRPITQQGVPLVGQGHIAYYPRFWNPVTKRMEIPNDELKKYYKELRSLLRENATIVKLGSRKYHLTAEAKMLGWKLAHIDVKLP